MVLVGMISGQVTLGLFGCSRKKVVLSQDIKTLYTILGFKDVKGTGIIEKGVAGEGYKKEADINGDGKIVEAEAKYYLQNHKNISSAVKQKYPLTWEDKDILRPLFVDVYEKACKKYGVPTNEMVRGALISDEPGIEIDLDSANVDDKKAKALAEVLKIYTISGNITIYLGRNNIGNDGAKALAEAIRSNENITDVYLFGNDFSAEGTKALEEAKTVRKAEGKPVNIIL